MSCIHIHCQTFILHTATSFFTGSQSGTTHELPEPSGYADILSSDNFANGDLFFDENLRNFTFSYKNIFTINCMTSNGRDEIPQMEVISICDESCHSFHVDDWKMNSHLEDTTLYLGD